MGELKHWTPGEPGGEYYCPELLELVTEYIGGALRPDERTRFDRHLGYCPGCVTYVDQVRRTIEIVGAADRAPPPPPEVKAELLALFRAVRGPDAPLDARCDEG